MHQCNSILAKTTEAYVLMIMYHIDSLKGTLWSEDCRCFEDAGTWTEWGAIWSRVYIGLSPPENYELFFRLLFDPLQHSLFSKHRHCEVLIDLIESIRCAHPYVVQRFHQYDEVGGIVLDVDYLGYYSYAYFLVKVINHAQGFEAWYSYVAKLCYEWRQMIQEDVTVVDDQLRPHFPWYAQQPAYRFLGGDLCGLEDAYNQFLAWHDHRVMEYLLKRVILDSIGGYMAEIISHYYQAKDWVSAYIWNVMQCMQTRVPNHVEMFSWATRWVWRTLFGWRFIESIPTIADCRDFPTEIAQLIACHALDQKSGRTIYPMWCGSVTRATESTM